MPSHWALLHGTHFGQSELLSIGVSTRHSLEDKRARHRPSCQERSTASCTPRRVRQRSIAWGTAAEFSASLTLRHLTVLTFTSIMVAADDAKDRATVLHSDFIDLGVIKGNIGDQNYSIGPMWTYRNIAPSPYGARGLVSISGLPH